MTKNKLFAILCIILIEFDQISMRQVRKPTLSSLCSLDSIGYKPTQRKVQVGSVQSPIVTHQNNYIKTFAGKGALIANGGMHSSNVINGLKIYQNSGYEAVRKFSKFAPVFASSLGVMGVIFGVVVDSMKPTLGELIERTNMLFENFAKEVNLRLDQLKGYVDAELIRLEKRLMVEDYQDISANWIRCADLYKDDIYTCQTIAIIKMLSQEKRFLKYKDKLNRTDNNKLMMEHDVRVIEANFPTFANYAFLILTNLDVLASTYESQCNDKEKHYFKLYSQKFIDLYSKFDKYKQKAIQQFKKLHTKNVCAETFKCTTSEEPSTHPGNPTKNEKVTRCSCSFDPTLPPGHCEFSIREFMPWWGGFTGEYYETSDTPENIGRHRIMEKSKEYNTGISNKIETEWKSNIMDLRSWDDAKSLREKQLRQLK